MTEKELIEQGKFIYFNYGLSRIYGQSIDMNSLTALRYAIKTARLTIPTGGELGGPYCDDWKKAVNVFLSTKSID